MPSYSILLMRTDATDTRPKRLNINTTVFWILVLGAASLPVLGFFLSVGWIAPNWLKFNMSSMQAAVKEAEQTLQPLQEQNAQLAEKKAMLEAQVADMRGKLAEAETKATMAETARTEATARLGQLEAEAVNLKQSVAKYEAMLKPKNATMRELVQCNDLQVRVEGQKITYDTSFSRTRSNASIPDRLSVQVRVAAGDNAMLLEQAKQGGTVVNHTLEMKKSQAIKGSIAAVAAGTGTLRMLDMKVMNGAQQVGYCWKAF
jgi:predicted RNase H-like nuclease (RuvC/YqgF family)